LFTASLEFQALKDNMSTLSSPIRPEPENVREEDIVVNGGVRTRALLGVAALLAGDDAVADATTSAELARQRVRH
jgi:hypothetical protein